MASARKNSFFSDSKSQYAVPRRKKCILLSSPLYMGEEGRKSASALKAGLTMQGADVAQIGDGVTSLCEAASSGAELEKFATLLRSSQDPVTIILFAHGSEGKHLIHLGPGFNIATDKTLDRFTIS